MERHSNALKKELAKRQPNSTVVKFYLDKEFDTRREWLKDIPADNRCQELLARYPCFKDHLEVCGCSNCMKLVIKFY